MADCKFPACKRFAEQNGYCIGHRIYAGASIKVKDEKAKSEPRQKPLPKQSPKRKKEQRIYRKQVKTAIEKDNRCKIKSPVCTGEAEGLDHKQKRSPANFLDTNNQVPACNACNLYKELNPAWAEAHGHTISRFKKTK